MVVRVCVAGATGWAGKPLVERLLDSKEFNLSGAVARRAAGQDIGVVLGRSPVGVSITASLKEALATPTDVLVDYTSPGSVKERVLEAVSRGVRVVIGTSGLTVSDYADIEAAATRHQVGIIAAGNFSVTAALAKHFALFAARYLPSWEIIDYAQAGKPDAPSGTTLELAEELARVRANWVEFPLEKTHGDVHARGASVLGTQIHSLRLPSYVISFETIFGLPDERLTIRHDAGAGAAPYVGGTMLAIQKVMTTTGLVRGLDRLLFT
ncbi:MAG TPA: 4-hydroxy-tetrahydrodipicolinate reductase [Thermoplasmata archaeon]|jgi:4-hydroxy-tetrahydrodipicolinate reductase|nr:4-hydroxy-tetrahydrodipicolinate reductase [Thermoplasmata archaeon]